MIYLTDSDLHAHIQIRLKDESQSDFQTAAAELEKQNIALIKSYLNGRYDTAAIFKPGEQIIDQVLTKILTQLVLYDLVRRNAARKVPSDYKEEYDKAISLLEKINAGKLLLDGLPKPKDKDGKLLSESIWGNNTNENFYL